MKLSAPAKINFGLWIGQPRPDGYHPVSTLFLPAGLYDTVTVVLNDSGGIDFTCDAGWIPQDATNICVRAAKLFLHETGTNAGVSIDLQKRIPAGAGLGGGSSDAAAVLMALNRMAFGESADERLLRIAAMIGADVPFFLYRRVCAARGIGEILTPAEFPFETWALIVVPEYHICTPDAYAAFDRAETGTGQEPDIAALIRSLESLRDARNTIRNDFEAVLFPHYPGLEQTKAALYELGADYASLSGSGSAVYGLFKTKEAAETAASQFADQNVFTAPVLHRYDMENGFF